MKVFLSFSFIVCFWYLQRTKWFLLYDYSYHGKFFSNLKEENSEHNHFVTTRGVVKRIVQNFIALLNSLQLESSTLKKVNTNFIVGTKLKGT